MSNLLDKELFRDADPTAGPKACPLGQNSEASRHQLHLTVTPEGTAGIVRITGIGRGAVPNKNLAPALFDSRFDAINMALGNRVFVFYGIFNELHFEFTGFAGGKKVSAVLVSQAADLLISGNGP